MVKKTFFYDDCHDGDRLVAEYIQNTPAAWGQAYNSPYQTYKYTTSGGVQYCTLMSEPDMADFELNILLKATNADAMMGAILRKARTTTWVAGEFYFWCTGGNFMLVFTTTSGATPVLSTVAYVVDTTKWHHLRARVQGRYVQGKIWPNDEPEPDWMISYYIGYNEIRHNGSIALLGTVRDVYFTNIHWTPRPRTGRATVMP